MIERVVANRLSIYLINESLKDIYQSALKSYHSAETALQCVDNNIRKALGRRQVIIVLLIDLSAAFDTRPHNTSQPHATALWPRRNCIAFG